MRSQPKNKRGNNILSHWDLTHGPLEPIALPVSYADPHYYVNFIKKSHCELTKSENKLRANLLTLVLLDLYNCLV